MNNMRDPAEQSLWSNDTQNSTSASALPVQAKCQNCNQTYTTEVNPKNGTGTWLSCLLFSCIGCCCIPLCCTDHFKDKVHNCPKCHLTLGVHEYKLC